MELETPNNRWVGSSGMGGKLNFYHPRTEIFVVSRLKVLRTWSCDSKNSIFETPSETTWKDGSDHMKENEKDRREYPIDSGIDYQ